jgi:hypothetical protein
MPGPHRAGHVGQKALRVIHQAVELTAAAEGSEGWMQILDFGRDDAVCPPLC